MAAAAQHEFPDGTPFTGCDIRRPRQVAGGRSGRFRYNVGTLPYGAAFWEGTLRIGSLGRASHGDLAGSVEGSVGVISGGNITFRVPVGRSGIRIEWEDASGNARTLADFADASFNLSANGRVTGMPSVNSATLRATLKPGAFVTVDNALHQVLVEQVASNNATLSLAGFLPAIPAATGSRKVVYRDPYEVGRVPAGRTIDMPFSNGFYGPIVVPWETQ